MNAVRFISISNNHERLLLTASVDKSIRVWKWDPGSVTGFRDIQIIQEHESSVNCIATLTGANIFVSGSSDGTVMIWSLKEYNQGSQAEFKLQQKVCITPKFLPLAIAIASLDSSSTVLAVAGTKNIIQIYVSNGGDFELAATLAGHEGWIRALDFVEKIIDGNRDLILASASQDKYIRLWRVHRGADLPAASRAANDPSLGIISRSLSNKAHRFSADTEQYSITFEALLLGHEDWIYTARWHSWQGRPQLLSASADNSLAIWEADPVSGIWVCAARLGEISAQKGSTTATGSTGGFWIGLWSPNADVAVSLSRTGGWRLWKRLGDDRWKQDVALSGHTKEVKAIAWSRNGAYLLSTGSDQTTRLHAPWKRNGKRSWHEFSRPQIHGYDLNCLDAITDNQFISGADEKLLRVFDEPAAVAKLLKSLSGLEITPKELPDAANIPVLGLSNKAIEINNSEEPHTNGEATDFMDTLTPISTQDTDRPPFEDQLSRHLLWPETEKLYGHGYEISCVAASHDRTLVATACRASSIDHALIRLYETREWLEIKPALRSHSLTVTSLKFSSDDKYLLSVGRDRQWTVFERTEDCQNAYTPVCADPKAHSRMILDGTWAPLEAGRSFTTAGRDRCIKFWRMNGDGVKLVHTITLHIPITALDFLNTLVGDCIVLAYGLEDGGTRIASLSKDLTSVGSQFDITHGFSPSKAVTALRWRPKAEEYAADGCESEHSRNDVSSKHIELAVASDDTSVRILALNPNQMQHYPVQ